MKKLFVMSRSIVSLLVIVISLAICARIYAADFEEIPIAPGTATYTLSAAKYNGFVSPTFSDRNSWKATTLSVAGTDICIRWDGGTPTASSGHKLVDGAMFKLTAFSDNANYKCVNASGGTGTLTVTYDEK